MEPTQKEDGKLRMMDFLCSPSVERQSNKTMATQAVDCTFLKSVMPLRPAPGARVEAMEKHQEMAGLSMTPNTTRPEKRQSSNPSDGMKS